MNSKYLSTAIIEIVLAVILGVFFYCISPAHTESKALAQCDKAPAIAQAKAIV